MLVAPPVRSSLRRDSEVAWLPSDLGYLNAAVGLLMTSTRRFCCRRVAESLPATGSLLPMPDATQVLDFRAVVPLSPAPAEITFGIRGWVRYRAKGELLSYTLRSDTAVVDQRCPCPASTIPNKITCWLRSHRQRGIDCTRICGSSRCR